jgi:hypothetical protein
VSISSFSRWFITIAVAATHFEGGVTPATSQPRTSQSDPHSYPLLGLAFDDAQHSFHSARNGLANTTNLVGDGCVQAPSPSSPPLPSLSIGGDSVTSPHTPEALTEAFYNITDDLQKHGMRASQSPVYQFR